MAETTTKEQIAAQAAAVADERGMCEVTALRDDVMDNGKRYRKGDVLHMHADLVPEHVRTGQISLAAPAVKQARPPRDKSFEPPQDKQVTTSANKTHG